MYPILFTSLGLLVVTLKSLVITSNSFSFTLNMATEFFNKVYYLLSTFNSKFFLIGLVGVLIDINIIFLIKLNNNLLDDILLNNSLLNNILFNNILPNNISLNRELGINKISNSNFNRDLDDNNSLYYKRISIDNK